MKEKAYAYFVKHPRRIEELQVPHDLSAERAYTVAASVRLRSMDYENFVTDMLADRQFLEDHAALCGEGDPIRCLLVQRRGGEDGVLVVPEGCYVKWAARYPG